MRFHIAVVLFFYICILSSINFSYALTPEQINNQEYIRQQERERVQRQNQQSENDVRLERIQTADKTSRFPPDESPCFLIHELSLKGQQSENFQWLLEFGAIDDTGVKDQPLGRCLGSEGIQLLMKRMQNALVNKGFVTTRVLAGPQDLSTGVLHLILMPGFVRHIYVDQQSSSRAMIRNAVPVKSGDLLNLKDIEQSLENFKRVPSVEADIQITPSKAADAQPGDSDIVVSWRQAMPFRFNLSADNSGSRETGKYQGAATFSYDHWWTLNDLFYATVNHDLGGGQSGDRGSHAYTLHYSLPLGYWMLGFTSGSNQFRQSVAGRNQTYLYSGESANQELRLSRLAYRDAVRKTTVSFSLWYRDSKNFIDDTEVEVQRRRMAGWEAGIAHREHILNAALDLNVSYRQGTGAMGSLPAPEEAFGAGTSRPQITTLSAQLATPFTVGTLPLKYALVARAQYSATPLLPQDRFSIGSRYTVRGFDEQNFLSAEHGWVLRNDLSLPLAQTAQSVYLGIDLGAVSGPSTKMLVGRRLSGMVAGWRGGFNQFSYDLFVGQPLARPEGFKTASAMLGFSLNLFF